MNSPDIQSGSRDRLRLARVNGRGSAGLCPAAHGAAKTPAAREGLGYVVASVGSRRRFTSGLGTVYGNRGGVG